MSLHVDAGEPPDPAAGMLASTLDESGCAAGLSVGAEIRLTRVKKQGGALLCKRIFLGENGRPQSDGSPCAMALGTATRVRLNGSPATNLCNEILDLGAHEALVLGDLADGLPDRIKLEKSTLR